MDEVQAKHFLDRIMKEGEIDGWKIIKSLGKGKSAIVVLAERDGVRAALKVFHPELLEKFGVENQLKRIAREQLLVGKTHPHLVQILGGGQCKTTKHVFVAMEVVDGIPVSEALDKIPRNLVPLLIKQLAEAAKFLEDLGLAHRDIKPDNVMLLGKAFDSLKLMDLGVIRPLDASGGITDGPFGTPFIGTLRYSPPELLHSKVKKSPDGWRAVTFYQIGAVLHDLIMRKPIFAEVTEPYPELVRTVDETVPEIASSDVDRRVIGLAKRCLVKNPEDRLRLVDWSEFFALGTAGSTTIEARKSALAKKQQLVELTSKEPPLAKSEFARLQLVVELHTRERLRSKVDRALEGVADVCPPRTVTTTTEMHPNPSVRCVLHKDTRSGLRRDLHCGFSVQQSPTGESLEVFVRGSDQSDSAGLAAPAWTSLGIHDTMMTGVEERIENWLVDYIEAAIDEQV